MKQCLRCHMSVVLEVGSVWGDPGMVWKCIGCGRETYQDSTRQVEDERLRRRIATPRSAHTFVYPRRPRG
jgi:hypothetical protein